MTSTPHDHPTPLAAGQRVRYVGIHGTTNGPTGRVSRTLKGAIRVRWDDGTTTDVHPEGIRAI